MSIYFGGATYANCACTLRTLSLPPQHTCIGPQKYGGEVGEGLEEVWGGAGRGVGKDVRR